MTKASDEMAATPIILQWNGAMKSTTLGYVCQLADDLDLKVVVCNSNEVGYYVTLEYKERVWQAK